MVVERARGFNDGEVTKNDLNECPGSVLDVPEGEIRRDRRAISKKRRDRQLSALLPSSQSSITTTVLFINLYIGIR